MVAPTTTISREAHRGTSTKKHQVERVLEKKIHDAGDMEKLTKEVANLSISNAKLTKDVCTMGHKIVDMDAKLEEVNHLLRNSMEVNARLSYTVSKLEQHIVVYDAELDEAIESYEDALAAHLESCGDAEWQKNEAEK